MRAMKILLIFISVVLSSAAYAIDTSEEERLCKKIGYEPKTLKFADCVLELYSRNNHSSGSSSQINSGVISKISPKGDGSPDDLTCQNYGMSPSSKDYSRCRMEIDMVRKQAAIEQARYESEMAAYQEQMKEIKAEQRRQRGMRQLELGLGLMSGDYGRGNNGDSSIPSPPRSTGFQNQTIRLPNGSIINCTTSQQYINCR